MTETSVSAPAYADVVDLDRYPIHDLDSDRGRAFVQVCKDALAGDGACCLPEFITEAAVAAMIDVADDLADQAWTSSRPHTIYFEEPDPSVEAKHPRAHQVRSVKHGIAYDQIPADAPMRRLYESDDLTNFIAAVLDKPVLHRSADPLDAFQVTRMGQGDELGWHFDGSEFSITVMYQPSEKGGEFIYFPDIRTAEDENYPGVQAAIHGDETGKRSLPGGPGTLAFFHGRNALHHVTPVTGSTPRINSVLTYGEVPNMRLNDLTSELFYGRTSS